MTAAERRAANKRRMDDMEYAIRELQLGSNDMRADVQDILTMMREMRGASAAGRDASLAAAAGVDRAAETPSGHTNAPVETPAGRTPAAARAVAEASGPRTGSTRLATGGASTHLAPPGDTIRLRGAAPGGGAEWAHRLASDDVPDHTGHLLRAADLGGRTDQVSVDRLARASVQRLDESHLSNPVVARDALVSFKAQMDGFVGANRAYPTMQVVFAPGVLEELRSMYAGDMKDIEASPSYGDRIWGCWQLLVSGHGVQQANTQAMARLSWSLSPSEAAAREQWRRFANDVKAVETITLPTGTPDLTEYVLGVIAAGSRLLSMRLRRALLDLADVDVRRASPSGLTTPYGETKLAMMMGMGTALATRSSGGRMKAVLSEVEYAAYFLVLAPAPRAGAPFRRDARDGRGREAAQVAAVDREDTGGAGGPFDAMPETTEVGGAGRTHVGDEEEVAYVGAPGARPAPCPVRHDQLARDGAIRCPECGRSVYPLTAAQLARGAAAARGGHAGGFPPGGGMARGSPLGPGGAYGMRGGFGGMRGAPRGGFRGGMMRGMARGAGPRPRPDALAAGASLLPRAAPPPYQPTVAAASVEAARASASTAPWAYHWDGAAAVAAVPAGGAGSEWHRDATVAGGAGHDAYWYDGAAAEAGAYDARAYWGDGTDPGVMGGMWQDPYEWYGQEPSADGYISAVLAEGMVDAGAVDLAALGEAGAVTGAACKPVRHAIITIATAPAPCTTVLLDTGAERCLINRQLLVAAELDGTVQPTDVRLRTASGEPYKVHGTVGVPYRMVARVGTQEWVRTGALQCCVVDTTPAGIGMVVSHHEVDDPTLASPFAWLRAISSRGPVTFPVPGHLAQRTEPEVVAAVATLSLRGLLPASELSWPTPEAEAEARAADAAEPATVVDEPERAPRIPEAEMRGVLHGMINPDLTTAQHDMLYEVLHRHSELWQPMQRDDPVPDLEAVITLTPGKEGATYNTGESRFAPALLPHVRAYLADAERAGVIERCEPVVRFCSRLLSVPKPTTPVTFRFVLSLINLNRLVTPMVAAPLDMEPALQAAAAAEMLTTSDATLGFGQLVLAEASRDYTAFVVEGQWWRCCRLPMGYVNSSSIFVNWLDGILRIHRQRHEVSTFIDDLTCMSDAATHAATLDAVFTTLRAHHVRLSARKTRVGYTRVALLGRVVGGGRISPAPDRLQAVAALTTPNTAARLKAFVSLVGWFRAELHNAHELLAPLLPLMRDGAPVARLWGPVHNAAVARIKAALLRLPDRLVMRRDRPFIITTDASRAGVAAVLWQVQPGGDAAMVYCVSRSLAPPQLVWPVGDIEGLALLLAVQKFAPFIRYCPDTIVYCDHKDLEDMLTSSVVPASPRMQRWRIALAQFPLRIVYLPGVANSVADAFSREVAAGTPPFTRDSTVAAVVTRRGGKTPEAGVDKGEAVVSDDADVTKPHKAGGSTRAGARVDGTGTATSTAVVPAVSPLRAAILLAQQHIQSATRAQMARSARFKLVRDAAGVEVIHYDNALWVPPAAQDVQRQLLELAHEAHAHGGAERTLAQLRAARITWPGMAAAVRRHVMACLGCARARAPASPTSSAPLLTTPPHRLFEALAVDFAGVLPATSEGYTYILVAVDAASRWVTLIPTRDTTAATVIDAITRGVLAQPRPPFAVLISDGATSFCNGAVAAWLDVVGAAHMVTAPYNARANGLVERQVGIVLAALRKLPGDRRAEWHKELPPLAWALNTSVNATTGVSPYTMLTGAAPISGTAFAVSQSGSPFTEHRHTFDELCAFLEARYAALLPHVLRERERQHAVANAGRVMPDHPVGSTVLVHLPAGDGKLGTPYRSVYRVLAAPNAVIREVVPIDGSKERAFAVHVDRLVQYAPDPTRHDVHQVAHQQLGQDYWLVEALEAVRRRGRRIEVLVRWRGEYPPTWEPLGSVQHLQLFPAFARAHPLARE